MTTRSSIFHTRSSSSPGVATLYTCPADRVALVKFLTVCERAGAAAVFSLLMRQSSGGVNVDTYLFRNVPLAANGTWVLPVPIVLNDISSLRLDHVSGGSLATYMGGSLLVGDAV